MVQLRNILVFAAFLFFSAKSSGHPHGHGFNVLHSLRNKRDDKVETHTDYGEMSFFEATKLFACVSDICQKIKEFSISKAPRTCHDEYIPIVWDHDESTNNSKKRAVSGFLTPDGSVSIEQKTSKDCKLLKRYNYNDNKSLIQFDEKVNEVDIDKSDAYILGKLWQNGAYFRWSLYNLGYFDNRENTFSDKSFFKDFVVIYVILKLVILIICTAINFLQKIQQTILKVKEMMENYDKVLESAGKAKKSK